MDKEEHDALLEINSRLIRLETELLAWKTSVERRLDDYGATFKWIVGLIGSALVVLVSALLLRGGIS